MQEQEFEVSFCDLCGTSVPAADLDAKTAVVHQGKTIGSCCLSTLRGTGEVVPPAKSIAVGGHNATAATAATAAMAANGDSGRILTVAIVLLVAFAGGVIFLDSRVSRLAAELAKVAEETSGRQKADSDALQELIIRSDGFALQKDVAAIGANSAELAGVVSALSADSLQRQAVLSQEFGGLRTLVGETMAKLVDYRPLFEDLRQRHTRALLAIEGMRSEVTAVPASVVSQPAEGPPIQEPVIDLPNELADQVRKLAAADPAVRFEAVDVLVESKDLKVLPYLLPLAKDPDAFVRRLTVEGLREFRKPEAVDALVDALRDEDENVCDTAWTSLRDLTGQKFKFESSASKEARARAAQVWQDWWTKSRATFGS